MSNETDTKTAVARQVMTIASGLAPGILRNLLAEENAGDDCMVWYVDDDGRRQRACDFAHLQAMALLCLRFRRLHELLDDTREVTMRLVRTAEDDIALDEPTVTLTQTDLETILARAVRDVLANFKELFVHKALQDRPVPPAQVLELIDGLMRDLATRWPLTPSPETT